MAASMVKVLLVGGGMSEDWKLSYGVSTLNVREVSIKDFDGNMIASINGQVIGYFGLLD